MEFLVEFCFIFVGFLIIAALAFGLIIILEALNTKTGRMIKELRNIEDEPEAL